MCRHYLTLVYVIVDPFDCTFLFMTVYALFGAYSFIQWAQLLGSSLGDAGKLQNSSSWSEAFCSLVHEQMLPWL